MKDLDKFIAYHWDEINHNLNTCQTSGIYQDQDGYYKIYNTDELQQKISELI